ncbi:hypothetical protein BWI17_21670 [Betaproteobacteria bacterium GR16-43]|nr:hypothetical protein BWI17_21670 [Betaproteobacteria bacterium GR16-43]
MRARSAIAAASVFVALAAPAYGCGFCIEDKVAAVYDHAAVEDALLRHRHVAFLALEGPVPDAAAARREIGKALASTAGAEARSLRLSVESSAISVTFDPKRIAPEALVEALNRKLAHSNLAVSILQVRDGQEKSKT